MVRAFSLNIHTIPVISVYKTYDAMYSVYYTEERVSSGR